MNYEALGKYTYFGELRQEAQRKLSVLAAAVQNLSFSMKNYSPPYTGKDVLPEQIAAVRELLPEIGELQQRIVSLGQDMSRLRDEYNLKG
jgi:hypothetical protein